MNIHEKYISRCIQLAQNGLGNTYPNPLVGSVLVVEDKIIGEGWHQKSGGPHAEVNAINSVKDPAFLNKATIYVSLEPCSHYGKTPPCSDLIIHRGIKKVVIGTVDPFEKVAGKGIKKLLEAGCEVKVGFLETQCRILNKRFFTFLQKKRPYIILKWAQTADGFIAPNDRKNRAPVWITNKYTNLSVHKWRSEEQAILIGTNTAVADNPQLTTRNWSGSNPTRIVIDQNLRIPKDSAVFDGNGRTMVICGDGAPEEKQLQLDTISYERIDFSSEIAGEICKVLYKHNIQSLIIEGGTTTLETFLNSGLWDEARVFTGSVNFTSGIKAPLLKAHPKYETTNTGDRLNIYMNDYNYLI